MGTNASWLSVRGTMARVASAVVASYEERGALCLANEGNRPRLPTAKKGQGARLELSVVKGGRGWVYVLDSRRSPSDLALAKDVSRRLRTTVFRESVFDTSSYECCERFGPPLAPSNAPSDPPRFEDEAPQGAVTFLVFEGVTERVYDEGPLLSVKRRCKACGCPSWSPGFDVPHAPTLREVFRLRRGRKPADTGSLLVAMKCNQCGVALGFAEARLEAGLVVEVEALRAPPTDLLAFDWALVAQRKEVEALRPPPAPRKDPFASAFADEPRAALSAELAKLRVKGVKGHPPPLAWVFAATRDELIATFVAERPTFTWKPMDLPAKIEHYLLTGLRPAQKTAPVAAFLDRLAARVGPGAFARQGRDPETLIYRTAVGFSLPDGSWAALLMLD